MEKLTPSKFGEEKVKSGTSQKTGKAYSFKTVGFVSNEYPDRWYNINYNDHNPLTVGKTYEFEIASREYNGKMYYDAKLPQQGGRGMSPEQFGLLRRDMATIITKLDQLLGQGRKVELTSVGDMDFSSSDEEPPLSAYNDER